MIGGNTHATLQRKKVQPGKYGATGDGEWVDITSLTGWLDLIGGGGSDAKYSALLQDSTHIFLCDYRRIEAEGQLQLVVNGAEYDVKLIDNPMGLNQQLEIYLSYHGGRVDQ